MEGDWPNLHSSEVLVDDVRGSAVFNRTPATQAATVYKLAVAPPLNPKHGEPLKTFLMKAFQDRSVSTACAY